MNANIITITTKLKRNCVVALVTVAVVSSEQQRVNVIRDRNVDTTV